MELSSGELSRTSGEFLLPDQGASFGKHVRLGADYSLKSLSIINIASRWQAHKRAELL